MCSTSQFCAAAPLKKLNSATFARAFRRLVGEFEGGTGATITRVQTDADTKFRKHFIREHRSLRIDVQESTTFKHNAVGRA